MTLLEFSLVTIIVAFAGFTQGVAGFGGVFILIPLLSLFFGVKTTIPLVNFLASTANIYLSFKLLKHIPWKKLVPFVITTLPGMFIGAYFLKTAKPGIIQAGLGLMLIFYALYLLFVKPHRRKLHFLWDYITSFIAGITGAAFGASSPPTLVYVTMQPWTKDFTTSFLASYFFFCGIMAFCAHASLGLITSKTFLYFALTIPIMFLSTYLGHRIYKKISETFYRKIITLLILLLGILMLWQGIF
ncbi:MAG: sulfite exporter TauE/SafE family protein [Verrucomicrobiota bacterium]